MKSLIPLLLLAAAAVLVSASEDPTGSLEGVIDLSEYRTIVILCMPSGSAGGSSWILCPQPFHFQYTEPRILPKDSFLTYSFCSP